MVAGVNIGGGGPLGTGWRTTGNTIVTNPVIVGNPSFQGNVSLLGTDRQFQIGTQIKIGNDGINNAIQDISGNGLMLSTSGSFVYIGRSGFGAAIAIDTTGGAVSTWGVVIGNGAGAITNTTCLLDLQSTTKTLVVTRHTTAQKNAITTAVDGAVLYDSDLTKFQFRENGLWTTFTWTPWLTQSAAPIATATPYTVTDNTTGDALNGTNNVSGNFSAFPNNTLFTIKVNFNYREQTPTAGASGFAFELVGTFLKNNLGNLVQVGTTTTVYSNNSSGDTWSVVNLVVSGSSVNLTLTKATGTKTFNGTRRVTIIY